MNQWPDWLGYGSPLAQIPTHVRRDGPVLFLGVSNHLPIDPRETSLHAIDPLAIFHGPPRQRDK